MSSTGWVSLVLAFASLLACGRSDGSDGDAAQGGRQSAAGSGGGAGEEAEPAHCFESAEVPNCSALSARYASLGPVVLVQASDVAAGARFTKLGGWAALAELPGNAAPRLVLVPSWDEPGPEVLEIEHDGLQIVAVFGAEYSSIGEPPARVAAVGCDDAGCQLLLRRGEETLSVAPEYAFPRGIHIEGLVADVDQLCAYGDGLFCWEGGVWRERISVTESGRVIAATLGGPTAALTAAGIVFVEDGEVWRAEGASVPEPVGFDALDGTISVIGADGMWQVSSDTAAAMNCRQSPRLMAAALGRYGVRWLVLDEGGEAFLQLELSDGELAWCRPDHGFAVAARAVSRIECSTPFLLAITDDALLSVFGQVGCFID